MVARPDGREQSDASPEPAPAVAADPQEEPAVPDEVRTWPLRFQDVWFREALRLEDVGYSWQAARRLATEATRAEVAAFRNQRYPDPPMQRRAPNGPGAWA